MSSRVLTAVAWPYANGPRHIGHVSGFGVPSDVFSRYRRMAGDAVLMVSGTDEHGTPIQVQADAEGLTPRELADKYNRVIVNDLQGLGLGYDLFTRTTTSNHYEVVQKLFTALYENGYVFTRTAMGAISPSTGRTLPDRYVEGTCPICGYDGARGDQCDNCGNQLDPADLINPRSKINGEVPKFVETEHFFLDLPAFANSLGSWLSTRTDWRPNVLKFATNLVDDLKPRAITRDLDWGVPVPLDGWRDQPMKRLYVWFDAVIGYLSASVEWARRGPDPDAWKQWWTDPQARGYYFMGKDNIVFHSVIWPALLLGQNGAGDKGGTPGAFGTLNLPDEIVSSEFLTMSGSKFSTSRGTVIYVTDFLREFGPDALRYFISVGRPGEPGHRLHLGRVRPPHQLRAGQRVGQPRQPVDLDGAQERRRRAEADGADGGGRGAAGDVAGGVRHRRWPARAQQVQAGDLRGDAGGDRREPVPQRSGAVEAQGRPGPARHDPAHRAAGGAGREHAAHAVPAARRAEGARGAGRLGRVGGAAGGPGGRRPRSPGIDGAPRTRC